MSIPRLVGYAPGAFDLFHVGHLNLLRRARARCDFLVAGVVSDEMVRLMKHIDPVVPLAERVDIVANLRCVDDTYVEEVEDKLETWRTLKFDVFFKGDDWRGTVRGQDLERRFAAVGVEVVYLPYTPHTSSTRLRQALDVLDQLSSSPDRVG